MRPRCTKIIRFNPDVTYFKPRGVKMRDLDEVVLTMDEVEALRLANTLDKNMIEGAGEMQISKSTFHRLLDGAMKKIADAIINGKAIKIDSENITNSAEQTGSNARRAGRSRCRRKDK